MLYSEFKVCELSMKFICLVGMTVLMIFDLKAVDIELDGDFETGLMEVRLRSFNNTGGSEIYAGVFSVGTGSNRTELNYNWLNENWFEINYSYTTDLLRITLYDGMGGVINSLDYPNWESNMQSIIGPQFSARNLNALKIIIYNREVDGEFSFEDIELNGEAIGGGFNLPPGSVIPSIDNWVLTGECFAEFNLYGKVVKSGTISNSQELGKIEFQFGIGGPQTEEEHIFSNGFDYCY
jgi:hypothetical protein